MFNRIKRFVGWSLAAAVLTPLSPLGVGYALCHQVVSSGNGADAWGTFAIGMASFFCLIALIVLGVTALASPVSALIMYGAWCVTVGIFGAAKA